MRKLESRRDGTVRVALTSRGISTIVSSPVKETRVEHEWGDWTLPSLSMRIAELTEFSALDKLVNLLWVIRAHIALSALIPQMEELGWAWYFEQFNDKRRYDSLRLDSWNAINVWNQKNRILCNFLLIHMILKICAKESRTG